ncbi:Ferric enterobactin transport system permease protein fepD [Serratia rubidaea]|uniref:Ferric enterobactin transport system permease protein fepD n=1 Tax=Serratia rubidaea TaxID=61652 RepID=A0A4V6JIK4_SERRU|nr:Ferric enterobactin transport system permease protein fepD [Serratia rubidaea]
MMPHIARRLAGSELHWILPWTLVLTPILLLSADLIGRFLVPGELRVSIVTALIGAPVLIALVRQRHMFRRSPRMSSHSEVLSARSASPACRAATLTVLLLIAACAALAVYALGAGTLSLSAAQVIDALRGEGPPIWR